MPVTPRLLTPGSHGIFPTHIAVRGRSAQRTGESPSLVDTTLSTELQRVMQGAMRIFQVSTFYRCRSRAARLKPDQRRHSDRQGDVRAEGESTQHSGPTKRQAHTVQIERHPASHHTYRCFAAQEQEQHKGVADYSIGRANRENRHSVQSHRGILAHGSMAAIRNRIYGNEWLFLADCRIYLRARVSGSRTRRKMLRRNFDIPKFDDLKIDRRVRLISHH